MSTLDIVNYMNNCIIFTWYNKRRYHKEQFDNISLKEGLFYSVTCCLEVINTIIVRLFFNALSYYFYNELAIGGKMLQIYITHFKEEVQ